MANPSGQSQKKKGGKKKLFKKTKGKSPRLKLFPWKGGRKPNSGLPRAKLSDQSFVKPVVIGGGGKKKKVKSIIKN